MTSIHTHTQLTASLTMANGYFNRFAYRHLHTRRHASTHTSHHLLIFIHICKVYVCTREVLLCVKERRAHTAHRRNRRCRWAAVATAIVETTWSANKTRFFFTTLLRYNFVHVCKPIRRVAHGDCSSGDGESNARIIFKLSGQSEERGWEGQEGRENTKWGKWWIDTKYDSVADFRVSIDCPATTESITQSNQFQYSSTHFV